MIKISPSVLASDLSRLADEVIDIDNAGADMIHLDVMDGVFVTNISFGLSVLECLRKNTNAFFDVHLMITKPERYIERFITEAGADLVTFHIEATDDVDNCLSLIKKHGKKAAISIKPNTPAEAVYPYIDKCDMILVMTVEPGFGGQSFMADQMPKAAAIRREIEKQKLNVHMQTDGGIDERTAPTAAGYGSNILVAGTAVFRNPEGMPAAVERLHYTSAVLNKFAR